MNRKKGVFYSYRMAGRLDALGCGRVGCSANEATGLVEDDRALAALVF